MKAVCIDSSTAPETEPFSESNPATSNALRLATLPTPKPSKPGEILVQVKASTVIRDTLTWPEMYNGSDRIPGHDFAGTVISSFHDDSPFKPGDEVYGMAHADRGGCWADHTIVRIEEVASKPKSLSWGEAAALPLSGLTAWQALFNHAGISMPDLASDATSTGQDKSRNAGRLLITGASGGVGLLMVQLARATSYHVVTATSSKSRTEELLTSLGADEVVSYDDLASQQQEFDIVIDAIGGAILEKCWAYTKANGTLITIESASYDFVNEHRSRGIARDDVKASFFIVESSSKDLAQLSKAVERGLLKTFVAAEYPLEDVKEAYDNAHSRGVGRGKVVLTM